MTPPLHANAEIPDRDRRLPVHEAARARGVDALGDAELLQLAVGVSPRTAGALLDECGGVGELSRAGDIVKLVGRARALRMAAAIELGRRATSAVVSDVPMTDPHEVARWATARLCRLEHEELWVLALDGRNHLRAARRVAMGGLHGVHVSVRDVLRPVLREGASGFVLVHNHPSGDPTPSQEDVEFTRRIEQAAEVVGVPLLDHVVVARHGARGIM